MENIRGKINRNVVAFLSKFLTEKCLLFIKNETQDILIIRSGIFVNFSDIKNVQNGTIYQKFHFNFSQY